MTSVRDFVQFGKYALNPYEWLNDYYSKNWNDYEALGKLAGFDFVGIPARFRRGELEAEENHRYWDDWSKNTGVSIDARKYPIRSGTYSNYGYIGSSFNSSASSFARLYKFSKPRKYTINNYRNNVKYYR